MPVGFRKVPDRELEQEAHEPLHFSRRSTHISPCIKYLLFSFNFTFWMAGALFAAFGIWVMIEKDKEVRDILDLVFDPAILIIGAGGIIFSVAFFGCLGALRENICLLKTFQALLIIILILETVLSVAVFVFYYIPDVRKTIKWFPEEDLKRAIIRYRDDLDLRDAIDVMQREFQCCGISNDDHGYQDWQDNVYFNCTEENTSVERCGVPYSCCRMNQGELVNLMCGFDTTNQMKESVEDRIYTQGCLKGFGSWLERNAIIIGAVSLGVIIPQFLGICLTKMLMNQINMQIREWWKWH